MQAGTDRPDLGSVRGNFKPRKRHRSQSIDT